MKITEVRIDPIFIPIVSIYPFLPLYVLIEMGDFLQRFAFLPIALNLRT